MTNEFQVVFHNIDQSDAVMDAVNKRISKLERYCDQIIAGRVGGEVAVRNLGNQQIITSRDFQLPAEHITDSVLEGGIALSFLRAVLPLIAKQRSLVDEFGDVTKGDAFDQS